MNSEKMHNLNNLLVHRYQNGEEKALGLLIKRFHPVMLRTIRHYTGNSESIEDIAQECWYNIIPQLADIQLKISFDAWALSIAQRRSVDWIRMQQRSRARDGLVRNRTESETSMVNDEESQDIMEKIHSGIRQLSPTQRIVLNLFYLENLSMQEISGLLDISAGTVKSRLYYARENLKNIITNPKGESK